MNISDYQPIIKKTAVFPKTTDKFDAAYAALGLTGEAGELVQAVRYKEDQSVIVKEAGDVYWYITALANAYGFTLEQVIPSNSVNLYFQTQLDAILDALLIETTKVSEMVKKTYRDAHMDQSKRLIDIKLGLTLIAATVAGILNVYSCTLEECLEENYNKLISRKENNTLHGDGDDR